MSIATNLLQSLIPISQNKTVSLDSVMNNLGISEAELFDAEDVDIE